MGTKQFKTFIKHFDFIIADLIVMMISFIIATLLTQHKGSLFQSPISRHTILLMMFSQLIAVIFSNNYSGILQRRRLEEIWSIGTFIAWILFTYLILVFILKDAACMSRSLTIVTLLTFWLLASLERQVIKWLLRKHNRALPSRSIVLITDPKHMKAALAKMTKNPYRNFKIPFAVLVCDKYNKGDLSGIKIPLYRMTPAVVEKIRKEWVDEIFFLQPDTMLYPTDMINNFIDMGITVNYTVAGLNEDDAPVTSFGKLGGYKVITSNINQISGGAKILKRLLDIVGAIVGLILTGIIYLFVAPAIKKADPGPVFFKQQRVGQNGKVFDMYKFRSMYLDAEERKAELMKHNEMSDGLMFKMEDDPRIIGSEKKDKDGRPCGIGNFIRNTSLDEFPQFWNVLKGDMSLVGWRPATLDEWAKYDQRHRVRASMKPGITGLWQVSGRNEITDFDEVVKLDKDYIEHWSLYLDLAILVKTVVVVLTRKGAK